MALAKAASSSCMARSNGTLNTQETMFNLCKPRQSANNSVYLICCMRFQVEEHGRKPLAAHLIRCSCDLQIRNVAESIQSLSNQSAKLFVSHVCMRGTANLFGGPMHQHFGLFELSHCNMSKKELELGQGSTHFQISTDLQCQEMLIPHDQSAHEHFRGQTIELLNRQWKPDFGPSYCIEHAQSLARFDKLLRIQVWTECFAISSSLRACLVSISSLDAHEHKTLSKLDCLEISNSETAAVMHDCTASAS